MIKSNTQLPPPAPPRSLARRARGRRAYQTADRFATGNQIRPQLANAVMMSLRRALMSPLQPSSLIPLLPALRWISECRAYCRSPRLLFFFSPSSFQETIQNTVGGLNICINNHRRENYKYTSRSATIWRMQIATEEISVSTLPRDGAHVKGEAVSSSIRFPRPHWRDAALWRADKNGVGVVEQGKWRRIHSGTVRNNLRCSRLCEQACH